MEKVSLYIPCYNAEKFIRQSIEGALHQTYLIDEILIIDDSSNDKTVAVSSRYPVKVIKHGLHKGLAATRNTAFKSAKNEFIAALDADCSAAPDWLEELMRNFIEDSVAGVGGRLIGCKFNVADRWREAHIKQDWGSERIENPAFLYGSNTVYKKGIILKVGLYNEMYKSNYEDCDISGRIIQMGFKLIYNPYAQAVHLKTDSVKSVMISYWNWHFYVWPKPISWEGLMLKTKENFGLLGHYCRMDIKNKDCSLVYIDIASFLYHLILDIRYYLRNFYQNKKWKKVLM